MADWIEERHLEELRSLRRGDQPSDGLLVDLQYELAGLGGEAARWLKDLILLGCWPLEPLKSLLLRQTVPPIRPLRKMHTERLEALKALPTAVALLSHQNANEQIYYTIVEPACRWENLRPVLIVKIEAGAQTWLKKARDEMESASLFIADVSENNPNVFYEIGYMDGLGKPGAFISLKRGKIPHYINDREISRVELGLVKVAECRAKLRAELRSIRNNGNQSEVV
jgi:hypothetical protein